MTSRSQSARGAGFRAAEAPARSLLALALALAAAACGGKVVLDETDDPTGATYASTSTSSSSGSGAGGGGDEPGEWTTLIDGTWELAGGTEGYWCTVKTIQADTYIKAFRALAPLGTHHTLLLRTGDGPDGESACGPTLGSDMLHASGIGTDDLTFPEGVAVKVPAGTKLLLNLHLFNTDGSPLKGVSGTLVKLAPASEVKQIAELVLAGATSIAIPPNGSQTVEGKCTFPSASTITTVWPHMHKYGTHMKVTYEGASGTKVLHNGPFSFGDQKNYAIDPVNVAPGESIRVQCTYQNPTPQTIFWGDSSESEMCFGGLYRFPALEQGCF
jgi:hypothetical protein